MSRRSRLLLAMLGAIVVLVAMATSAFANRLAIGEPRFRIIWAEMKFIDTAIGGVMNVRCPVTFEGSFHSRTISKVQGALIGYVTRALVNQSACVGGRLTWLTARLPWHLRYEGFSITLPNISNITSRITSAEYLVEYEVGGGTRLTCLYITAEPNPLRLRMNREGGGMLTTAEALAFEQSPTGGSCPRIKIEEIGGNRLTRLGAINEFSSLTLA